MARPKRTSPILEKSDRRASAMGAIDPNLDLGNGLTLLSFSALIEIMRAKENAYNSALSNLDKLYHEMLETERELGDMAEHMLIGVAAKYGKSSVEYGMAGGVPKNQRRKGLRGNSTSNSNQSTPTTSTSTASNGSKATTSN
jgi:hypothetical protein